MSLKSFHVRLQRSLVLLLSLLDFFFFFLPERNCKCFSFSDVCDDILQVHQGVLLRLEVSSDMLLI